jgi:uncharacterized protein DUF1569
MSDPLAVILELADAVDAAAKPLREPAWPVGKALAHCAQSIACSVDGYPQLRSGLFRATIGRIAKRKFLRANRMSHDLVAAIAGAPEISDAITLADARVQLIAAVEKFRSHAGPLALHLAYGTCSKDDYAVLHLLHVEDHLRAYAS